MRREIQWKAAAGLALLAMLAPFPACAQDNPAAKVLALSGRVSVMRDSTPWALSIGDQIQPRQLIVTGPDGFAIFQVADGSTFEVYPNSRVTFRDNPGNWKDLLEVWLGRVKTTIQKLNGQPNYNKVRTPTAVISVRGTVFDIVVEDEDGTTLVSVDEGLVSVNHRLLPRAEVYLPQGSSVRVFKNVPLAVNRIDKGGLANRVLRAGAQAMYEVLWRTSRPGGGGSGVPGGPTGGVPGDRGPTGEPGDGGAAPPPPPPPPPPQ